MYANKQFQDLDFYPFTHNQRCQKRKKKTEWRGGMTDWYACNQSVRGVTLKFTALLLPRSSGQAWPEIKTSTKVVSSSLSMCFHFTFYCSPNQVFKQQHFRWIVYFFFLFIRWSSCCYSVPHLLMRRPCSFFFTHQVTKDFIQHVTMCRVYFTTCSSAHERKRE